MSNSGIVNYFNEMFLGKEELSKKQEMERSAFLGTLNIFGQHGLFDLKSQGAQLELVYDSATATCNINLKFQRSAMRILGFVEGKYPLVYSSMLSTKVIRSRPDTDDKFYVCLVPMRTSTEDGTVTVSEDGTVIGTGTSFTKILRGGKRQSRIKVGPHIFSVSHVENDTLLYLQGSDFPELFDMKFGILPTLSPFSEENNNLIYEYDSCNLTVRAGGVPDEVDIFQIAEFNWSDIVSGLIQGSSSDWFSQKTLLGKFLLEETVGTEELKPSSVTTEKLDLSLKLVDNLSNIQNIPYGSPSVVSLRNSLKKPSDPKEGWTLDKLQVPPAALPITRLSIITSGFSSNFSLYPEELKLIIDRTGIDQTEGHSLIKINIENIISFDFPQSAFRVVISFQKNMKSQMYEYLYHVNCL